MFVHVVTSHEECIRDVWRVGRQSVRSCRVSVVD